jgi:hypothetical protein
MKQPEHLLGPAFDKAREWEAQQETLLTETQRRAYEDLKKSQAKNLEQDKQRLDAFKKQLDEQEKSKKPKLDLALRPPVLTRDPFAGRVAGSVHAAERRHGQMAQRQETERTDLLKQFEKERAGKETPALANSWREALAKSAKQEKSIQRELGDDFDKTR